MYDMIKIFQSIVPNFRCSNYLLIRDTIINIAFDDL